MKPGGGKEWFSAAELAELKLAGLPATKRKINERAEAEGWALRTDDRGAPLARKRERRGGGIEYHVSILPAAARSALVAQGVAAIAHVSTAPETRTGNLWRWFEAQSATTKAEAKRRAQVVAMIESYERTGHTRSSAIALVAARWQVGQSTIWNWLQMIEGVAPADRLPFLAPKRAGGGAEAEVHPQVWQVFLSDYLRPEKPALTACYRRACEVAQSIGAPVPHERTFRRRLEREVDGRIVVAKRNGRDALRSTIPAQERSVAELHAMQAVNIDGHKFDVFVRWPDGSIGRPMMVAIQDVYSRKLLAWRVARTENAIDTRLCFAQLFERWGIPRECTLDNGRAFASKWITGGATSRFRFKIKDDEPVGLLTALGIGIHWALPFRGQSKPIERAFRDLCETIAKHPALAGCYTGNKPDAKPENYGTKAIDIETFRALVDRGIAAHNARPGRRTEIANGRSFDDVFAASYAVAPIGKATADHLRQALLMAEDRPTDRRNGTITLEGNRYWSAELVAHAGNRLTVRFDPDDLHSEIHAYTRDGHFIATVPLIEATGFYDKEAATTRRKQEAELRRQVRAGAEALDLLDAAELAAMLPDHVDEAPLPTPSVVRPVRHRGQTAAALKPLPETRETPVDQAAQLADRLSHLRLV